MSYFQSDKNPHWQLSNIVLMQSYTFKITTMKHSLIIILSLIILTTCQMESTSSPTKKPCIAFQTGMCIACPYNYNMYQNECYLNITGCTRYSANASGMVLCDTCDSSVSVPDGKGGCTLTVSQQQLASRAYLSQVASNYGDIRFLSIPLADALNDPDFRIANNAMMTGQYKHFISLTSQPIQSVSTFTLGNSRQFKILYSGSGGGLMLCLINIDITNKAVQLSSFVAIGITSVVDNCDQYSLSIKCLQCLPGYHLQNSVCYMDIDGCISYSKNICISCVPNAYLIENRCLTACYHTSDLGQMPFYGNFVALSASFTFVVSRAYLLF